jgi:hypothetical protein
VLHVAQQQPEERDERGRDEHVERSERRGRENIDASERVCAARTRNNTHSPVKSAPARIATHVKAETVFAHDGTVQNPTNIAAIKASGTAATIHIRFISFHLSPFSRRTSLRDVERLNGAGSARRAAYDTSSFVTRAAG